MNRFIDSIARFVRLSHSERMLLGEAAAVLVVSVLAIRLFRFDRFRRFLSRREAVSQRTSGHLTTSELARIETMRRYLQALARYIRIRPSCLEFSAALWWLLRREGLPGQLRIGTFSEANRFQAHAWVELNGTVISYPREMPADIVPFMHPFLE